MRFPLLQHWICLASGHGCLPGSVVDHGSVPGFSLGPTPGPNSGPIPGLTLDPTLDLPTGSALGPTPGPTLDSPLTHPWTHPRNHSLDHRGPTSGPTPGPAGGAWHCSQNSICCEYDGDSSLLPQGRRSCTRGAHQCGNCVSWGGCACV